ncbi:MAG TPA: SusC/RagA family TonB-linked outer membrane protein, partial [Arachidicoccus sp.]|nr:SusC/RagA family TonB-linked outer membrane protein [Arachidicoccus sp.]
MTNKFRLKVAVQGIAIWGICSLICLTGYAQNQKMVTGRVTNAASEPLEGTTVHIKNQSGNTLTDKDGGFTIKVAGDAVLEFTRVGYLTTSRPVAGKTSIEVVMQETTGEMSTVIVTALGIKRDKRSLTYATQEIAGSEINRVKDPGGNIINSLSGKVANLVVTPAGSGPGGASKVVLRGNRSINGNNNALIVVDGVPIDNTMSTEAGGGGSANTFATQSKSISSGYSGMDGASSINPEDIESITVLKGPAAAALYGSRAANGALVITTKSGKMGKMRINYNGGFSIDQPYMLMKFQNSYGRGNGGEYSSRAGASWGAPKTTYKDNVSSFFQNGVLISNAIDISGGTDKLKGYASYANNSTTGIIPKNKLNRDNLNLRLWAEILPKLTLDTKLSYLHQNISHLPRLGDQGINNEAYIMPRDLSIDSLNLFETIDPNTGLPSPLYWTNSSTFANPYWEVNRMVVNQQRDRIMMMTALKYELTDWLSLQARYSLDKYDDQITGSYYNNTVINPFNTPGGLYKISDIHHWERNMDLLLTGHNALNPDLNLTYNIGASVLNIEGGNITSIANGLSVPNNFDLNFASSLAVTHVPIKKEIQSVYGNIQLDYKKLLYLDASLRNDWASTLPPPYRYSYPSIGLTAIVSDILKLPAWVTLGKIRGAITNVGNDANPYMLNQRYIYSQGAGKGFISRDGTKSIADLKPEQTHSIEIGTNWQFFGNRLGIDATYYKNNTK